MQLFLLITSSHSYPHACASSFCPRRAGPCNGGVGFPLPWRCPPPNLSCPGLQHSSGTEPPPPLHTKKDLANVLSSSFSFSARYLLFLVSSSLFFIKEVALPPQYWPLPRSFAHYGQYPNTLTEKQTIQKASIYSKETVKGLGPLSARSHYSNRMWLLELSLVFFWK